MEITLVRKNNLSDKDPLIILLDPDESIPAANRTKEAVKFAIGETKDFPDEIAYQIMAKHKGCFEMKQMKAEPDGKYRTKIAKPEL